MVAAFCAPWKTLTAQKHYFMGKAVRLMDNFINTRGRNDHIRFQSRTINHSGRRFYQKQFVPLGSHFLLPVHSLMHATAIALQKVFLTSHPTVNADAASTWAKREVFAAILPSLEHIIKR
jgi:hypothetical protein